MIEARLLQEPCDFSLVMGSPAFQLFRKVRLTGDHLQLLCRRLIVISLVAWLPLLFLTTLSTWRNIGRLSFLHDTEVHVRLLIALPILIAAELIVYSRLRPVVSRLVAWRIIWPKEVPRFHNAIESAIKLRNSIPVEVGLLLFVYTFGLWLWHGRVRFETSTWYAHPGGRLCFEVSVSNVTSILVAIRTYETGFENQA